MAKQQWKPGNMLYPLPVVMVSVRDLEGTIISLPGCGRNRMYDLLMVSISVRPERYSYHMLEESRAFVINLTTEQLCHATDFCGVRSGKDVDKFAQMKLTKVEASQINAPMIGEFP